MRLCDHWGLTLLKCVLMAGLASMAGRVTAISDEATVSEIPIQSMFRKAAYGSVVLSPNQRYLAALAPVNGRRNVVIVDLENRSASVLTGYQSRDVNTVFWANDDRLLYTTGDQQGLEFRGDGGLFAVGRDGKSPKALVEPLVSGSSVRFVYRATTVLGRIKGNLDEVMVSANDRTANSQDIYRMNVTTGRKSLVTVRSPGHVLRWVLDTNNEPGAALSVDYDKKRWWFSVRGDGSEPWRTVAQWDESLTGAMVPLAFDPTNNRKIYIASNSGRDTMAVFRFDTATGQLGDLVYGDDRFDVSTFHLINEGPGEGGPLLFDGTPEDPRKLIGIRYNADKLRTVWLDASAAQTQAAVDAALPHTLNQFNVNQRRAIVFAASDIDPGEYFIFDQVSRTLEETGLRTRPWIEPEKMAPMRYVTWTARDGMNMGGYLTMPLDYKPGSSVPTILHPHGGPWARDHWEYNPEVQFMVNRGFAVLQPNFRGSTGYGAQHLRASYREWGGTMIDDMIDGVEWAIKQGFADRARIGVYGASYGGYATLMAMVKRPDMFKWGINYVGVTDLAVHQDTQPAQKYSDFGELAKVLNGDQRVDKARFESQSPARHVERIDGPVFHAYGGDDRNVDIENGKVIRAAFDKALKPFEWMLVPGEAHGYRADKNVFEFYSRFDKFIKAHTPPVK